VRAKKGRFKPCQSPRQLQLPARGPAQQGCWSVFFCGGGPSMGTWPGGATPRSGVTFVWPGGGNGLPPGRGGPPFSRGYRAAWHGRIFCRAAGRKAGSSKRVSGCSLQGLGGVPAATRPTPHEGHRNETDAAGGGDAGGAGGPLVLDERGNPHPGAGPTQNAPMMC